jgi:hypothetical protein
VAQWLNINIAPKSGQGLAIASIAWYGMILINNQRRRETKKSGFLWGIFFFEGRNRYTGGRKALLIIPKRF